MNTAPIGREEAPDPGDSDAGGACVNSRRRTPSEHPIILLVEDDDDCRSVTAMLLSELGFTVIEACDGDEALVRYLAADVDVVLTDIFMPGMDGVDLIRALRSLDPRLPIVACSAALELHEDGLESCGEQVPLIAKPMRLPVLDRTLRAALDGT